MSLSNPLNPRHCAGALPLDTLFMLADQDRHSDAVDLILASRKSVDQELLRFELLVYMEYVVSLDREDVWGHYCIYNPDIDDGEDLFDINEFTECCFYKKCYKPLLEISYRPNTEKTLALFSRKHRPFSLTRDAVKALIGLGFSGTGLLKDFLDKIRDEENVEAFVACVQDFDIEREDVSLPFLFSGKLYDALFARKGLVSVDVLQEIGESASFLAEGRFIRMNSIAEVMFLRNLPSRKVSTWMSWKEMGQFKDIQKIVATLLLCLQGRGYWVKRTMVEAVWDSYFNNQTIIYGPISRLTTE